MVKKTEQQKLRDAINELTSKVETLSQHQEEMDGKLLQAEQESGKQRRKLQQSNLNLTTVTQANNLKIVHLAQQMGRFHIMMAGANQRNVDLTRALAQNALVNRRASLEFAAATNTGRVSFAQAIEAFGAATEMGMGGFSNATLRLATDMKVLGVDMRGVLTGIRFNTQMLGMSETTSRMFMDTLVSTAAIQKTAIGELVGVLNSFQTDFKKISLQFGPGMALMAQKAAIQFAGDRTELFEPMLELISKLVVGTEGLITTGRLTGGARFADVRDQEGFNQTLLAAIQGLQARDPGVGNPARIEALVGSLGITQEQLLLSRQLDGTITQLAEGITSDLAKSVTDRAATQQWQAQLFTVQAAANDALQLISTGLGLVGSFLIGGALAKSLGGVFNAVVTPAFLKLESVMLRANMSGRMMGAAAAGSSRLFTNMAAGLAGGLPGIVMSLVGMAAVGLAPKLLSKIGSTSESAKQDEYRAEQLRIARGNLEANQSIQEDTKKIANLQVREADPAAGNVASLLRRLLESAERRQNLLEIGNENGGRLNEFLGDAPAPVTGGMTVKPSQG